MYLSHFGLDEPPFRITPNTDFFYDGANRGAMLDALLYAITHDEGIVKVTGEVGSGKTMLCRVLINRLPKNVETIYLANPSLSREEILHAIAEELRVELTGQRTTLLLRALQNHLIDRYSQGQRVVVLIDEAHAMPTESLEEIRLLSNLESSRHKLLQIVLFGQPELEERLNRSDMRQLNERVTHSFRLDPLQRPDISSYIEFRLRAAGYRGPGLFTPAAQRLIATESQGLTRRVNILADKSLLAAFSDGATQVLLKHARAAVKDSGFRRIGRALAFNPWWLAAGGVAAGLLIGVILQFTPLWSWIGLGSTKRSEQSVVDKNEQAPPPSQKAPASSESKGNTAAEPSAPAPNASPEPPRPPESTADASSAPSSNPGLAGEKASRVAGEGKSDAPSVEATASRAADAPARTDAKSGDAAQRPSESPVPAASAAPELKGPDAAPLRGELARERYIATKRWLQETPADRYSIQLLTASGADADGMEAFLQRAAEVVDLRQVFVYRWRANGRFSYAITYGTFASLPETRAVIGKLPAQLRTFKPYPESVEVIRRLNPL